MKVSLKQIIRYLIKQINVKRVLIKNCDLNFSWNVVQPGDDV